MATTTRHCAGRINKKQALRKKILQQGLQHSNKKCKMVSRLVYKLCGCGYYWLGAATAGSACSHGRRRPLPWPLLYRELFNNLAATETRYLLFATCVCVKFYAFYSEISLLHFQQCCRALLEAWKWLKSGNQNCHTKIGILVY